MISYLIAISTQENYDMAEKITVQPISGLRGEISPPGDKSMPAEAN